jgi:hypothetical protein
MEAIVGLRICKKLYTVRWVLENIYKKNRAFTVSAQTQIMCLRVKCELQLTLNSV